MRTTVPSSSNFVRCLQDQAGASRELDTDEPPPQQLTGGMVSREDGALQAAQGLAGAGRLTSCRCCSRLRFTGLTSFSQGFSLRLKPHLRQSLGGQWADPSQQAARGCLPLCLLCRRSSSAPSQREDPAAPLPKAAK